MKIGILTFHRSHNYGATLQAYALQEYLKSRGADVYIIDYQPEYDKKLYLRDSCKLWLSKSPRMCFIRLLNYIKTRNVRHQRWDNFERFFNNRLNLRLTFHNDAYNDLDVIFLGSDQIWSASHTGGEFDPVFFGVNSAAKVVSYAPSTSSGVISESGKAQLNELLQNISHISVRETEFRDLLQPLISKSISVVVDPTLLAGKDVFAKIATCPKSLPFSSNRFVLVYEIKHHPELFQLAEQIALQMNADIVELTNGIDLRHDHFIKADASPEEFLWYFQNAACVVTTSFHGTAFSLIFERPFYTMIFGKPSDNRMIDILSKIGLQNRLVKVGDQIILSEIDYAEPNIRLGDLIAQAKQFIESSLDS